MVVEKVFRAQLPVGEVIVDDPVEVFLDQETLDGVWWGQSLAIKSVKVYRINFDLWKGKFINRLTEVYFPK
jgi:hypothetical protein